MTGADRGTFWPLLEGFIIEGSIVMKGYIVQIEAATRDNQHYRKVLFTAQHSQLVLMSLKPGEEIGEEVHELDQFLRFEEGEGTVILDGKNHAVSGGFAVVRTRHNVVNSGSKAPLKLYSLYSPPEHKDDRAQDQGRSRRRPRSSF